MKWIVALILLTSCGMPNKVIDFIVNKPVERDPRQFQSSDPAFYSYIDEFEYEFDANIDHIPINFGAPVAANAIATCQSWGNRYAEIIIQPGAWAKLSETAREILVFHELGHCYFKKHFHITKRLEDGCAASILLPFIISVGCYLNHREYYLDELAN